MDESHQQRNNLTSNNHENDIATCSATPNSLMEKRHYNLRPRNCKRSISNSSSSIRTFPCNDSFIIYKNALKNQQQKKSRVSRSNEENNNIAAQICSSITNINPTKITTSIKFDDIGGLDQHIKILKETILLPRLLPELHHRISLPRGFLFYGPSGTGKTLVARALASECSHGIYKMTFFAQKGADLLSKWVGESEKQLSCLFQKAHEMSPSIIFFDEIDGLAPARSFQDHNCCSVVSTLLALMDSLDDRGEIIVIGATNRIDAVDPALRRPGRFDHEFHFPLPSLNARHDIIKIHTKQWKPLLSDLLIDTLASATAGFCGADLKALCTEATLVCLRRCHPNLYSLKEKAVNDFRHIPILPQDFKTAMKKIIPAVQRQAISSSRPLPLSIKPLLQETFCKVVSKLSLVFVMAKDNLLNISSQTCSLNRPRSCCPRILIVGKKDQGQTRYLGPGILHHLENIPSYTLDISTICTSFSQNAEACCVQIFEEAKRNMPSILYFPSIDITWQALNTAQQVLLCLFRGISSEAPLLIFATSECLFEKLPLVIKELFDIKKNVVIMKNPNFKARQNFFMEILKNIRSVPKLEGKKNYLPGQIKEVSNLNETMHNYNSKNTAFCKNKHILKFSLDEKRLGIISKKIITLTKDWTISQMEMLGSSLTNHIYNHQNQLDKTSLLDSIEEEIKNLTTD